MSSLLGVGVAAFFYARKRSLAARGLTDGRAALQQGDWKAAGRHLEQYLSSHPDDIEVLKEYARAQMLIRPLELENVGATIRAYRRILRNRPRDALAFSQLATLYAGLRNFSEVVFIARKRLEDLPDDPAAMVWLAKGLISQHKSGEARETLSTLIQTLDQRPEKHAEYVQACWLLGNLDAQSESGERKAEALKWLDQAVAYQPKSPEALINRARFRRTSPAAEGQDRQAAMDAARADLERVEALEPADPRVRLFLSEEWMAHGDLDRAASVLASLKNVDRKVLAEHFPDPDDWTISRFLVAAKLSLRKGATSEGVALADEVLPSVKVKQQRVQVLPAVVELYLAGKKVADARRCLDEYLDALSLTASISASNHKVPYLKAIVAQAEGEPYRVIELLEPVVQRKPSLPIFWKLLVDAYTRTGQTRGGTSALKQYLRLVPGDRQMTMRLTREYIKQRDWGRALETARLAESLDPTDIAARLLRMEAGIAVAAAQQSSATSRPQLEALKKELASLRKSHPHLAKIRILQAILASDRAHLDEAERELKLAIDECSQTLDAELTLARLYFKTKRGAEAIEVCRAACKRHSAVAAPWQALAEFHRTSKHYDQARATLQAGFEAVGNEREKRDLQIKLALLDLLHGDRQAGVELLEDLAARYEKDVRVRSLLLGLPEVLRDGPRAQKLVDQIRLTQGQSGLFWRLHQASLWLAGDGWKAKRQQIADLLKRCVDADPAWPAPALLLGRMHERLGNVDRAEEIYRRTVLANPTVTGVAERLLSLLERQRRFPEAKKVLDRLDAGSQALSIHRVRTAIGTGDFAKAVDELKLRIANDAKDADSRVLLARLTYQQTKDAELALKYLDQAQAVASDSMSVTAARVSILRAEGRLPQARRILDAEVSRDKSFKAYLLRAAYLASIDKPELAEKDFKRLTTFPTKETQGYELLGGFYADTHRLDEAIATWDKGASSHPENLPLRRRLMKGLLMRGRRADRDRAIELLSHLENRLPDDPDLLRVRASLLLREGTQDAVKKARALLRRVVELRPMAVNVHVDLIRIAMEQRDYAEARDLAIQAQGANPSNTGLILARGRAERALKNLGMARELAQAALAEDANNVDACELLAQVALDSGDRKVLEEALARLEETIRKKPEDDRAQTVNAMVLKALGKREEGVQKLEAYTRTESGKRSLEALLALAELYRAGGDLANCDKRVQQAAALDPDSSAVMRARVVSLEAQKAFDKITALVSAHQETHPHDALSMMAAAFALASSGSKPHVQRAMTLFEQVIATSPQLTEAQLGLGVLTYQMGNVDRAEQIYRKVLESDPDNAQALNDLAWILAEARRDYEAALKLADRGVRVAPENRNLRDTRGVILSNLPGRLEDARRDFQECVALTAPDSRTRAKAHYRLGEVCARLKAFAPARRHLDEALRIDPTKEVLSPKERSGIDELVRTLRETGKNRSR